MVAFSGKTSLEALKQSLEALQGVGAGSVGVVLNCFDVRKGYGGYYRKAYGRTYGYYGSGHPSTGEVM